MKNAGINHTNQNAIISKKASLGKAAGPKDTTGGKDISRSATNSLGKHQGNKTYSPNSLSHSKNQWPKTGNYC